LSFLRKQESRGPRLSPVPSARRSGRACLGQALDPRFRGGDEYYICTMHLMVG
jgi:hypothetical protein